jgi:hypothetical protein
MKKASFAELFLLHTLMTQVSLSLSLSLSLHAALVRSHYVRGKQWSLKYIEERKRERLKID